MSTAKELVYMAKCAETAERYEDMCKYMKQLVELQAQKDGLSTEERNLLSVAYKNVIGQRRASWRILNSDTNTTKSNEAEEAVLQKYLEQIEAELKEVCEEILGLLVNVLLKQHTEEDEARVFYLKMTGDYYRYNAESVSDKKLDEMAADYYRQAFELAEKKLNSTHPIRLGLALNYSVCYYEILKDKDKACDLAKSAFDQAISKLDKLEEADYKDSTLIMQLLRDNLTLWTSDDPDDNDDDHDDQE